jgi:hypothetical protein
MLLRQGNACSPARSIVRDNGDRLAVRRSLGRLRSTESVWILPVLTLVPGLNQQSLNPSNKHDESIAGCSRSVVILPFRDWRE